MPIQTTATREVVSALFIQGPPITTQALTDAHTPELKIISSRIQSERAKIGGCVDVSVARGHLDHEEHLTTHVAFAIEHTT